MAKNYDVLLKVLIVGDTASRKTDLLLKYVGEDDTDANSDTLGLDYRLKDTVYSGKRVKLQLWDTAGQERFRSVTSSYYRGAQGCLLVFHMKKAATFSGLTYWVDEIKKNATEPFQTVLVGIGYDGGTDVEVDLDTAQEFAKEKQLAFTTVNLDSSDQVKSAFDMAVDKIMSESFKRKASDLNESIKINSARGGSGSQACFC